MAEFTRLYDHFRKCECLLFSKRLYASVQFFRYSWKLYLLVILQTWNIFEIVADAVRYNIYNYGCIICMYNDVNYLQESEFSSLGNGAVWNYANLTTPARINIAQPQTFTQINNIILIQLQTFILVRNQSRDNVRKEVKLYHFS